MSHSFIGHLASLVFRSAPYQKTSRALTTLVALSGFIVSASCSGDVTSPAQVPDASFAKIASTATSSVVAPDVLTPVESWLTPVASDITVSVDVTASKGGTLRIPSLGIEVSIPQRAVDVPTTITMTAMAGELVALDFQPAGTKFKLPLRVTQDLSLTHHAGAPFDVVYFKLRSDVDAVSKKVKVSEVIPVSVAGSVASFDIWHFSGYAISAGRGRS